MMFYCKYMFKKISSSIDYIIKYIILTQKCINMNKYQIKQKIGVGNFAEVFKCIHKQTNNVYAIKKITIHINTNEIMIYDSLKNSENVNIVKGIESFKHDGYQYIVMEYCANGSLDDYLKKHTKFSERLASIIIYFTTKGLKTLHQNKIIHRDLKAGNILFDDQYNVKINDFGLSKLTEQVQQVMKSRVGTPLYMSPQLLQNQPYTMKTDSWSIGVLMHLLITQKYPFYKAGQNEIQLRTNVRKQKLQFDQQISNEAKQFIKRCLVSDENKRINVSEILESKYLESIRLDQESAKKELFKFLSKEKHSKYKLYLYEHLLFQVKKKIQDKIKLFRNPNTMQKLQQLFKNENLQNYNKELLKILLNVAVNCQVNVNQKKLCGLNISQLLNIQNSELTKKNSENKTYSTNQINLALLRLIKQIFTIIKAQNVLTINTKKFLETYTAQFMKYPFSLKINITMEDVPQSIYVQYLNNFEATEHDEQNMTVVMEQVNADQYNQQRIRNILNLMNLS